MQLVILMNYQCDRNELDEAARDGCSWTSVLVNGTAKNVLDCQIGLVHYPPLPIHCISIVRVIKTLATLKRQWASCGTCFPPFASVQREHSLTYGAGWLASSGHLHLAFPATKKW
jgi:hypothetical protein